MTILQSEYTKTSIQSPIVIGGVGGSGTRIVAEILMHINIHLGCRLNESQDNLWFTGLFNCRNLFEKEKSEREKEIRDRLDLFSEAMIGGGILSDGCRQCLIDYAKSPAKDVYLDKEIEYYFGNWRAFIEDILSTINNLDGCIGWGWKEPNSHIILESLIEYFKDMKYIHVIRHGLDMAYSKNQNQAAHWGALYGVDLSDKDHHDPVASFRYWFRANQKVMHIGKKLLQDRFLVIKFEDLCNSPKTTIQELVRFLDLTLPTETLDSIEKVPLSSSSIGRYKKNEAIWVTDDDKKMLEEIGYDD